MVVTEEFGGLLKIGLKSLFSKRIVLLKRRLDSCGPPFDVKGGGGVRVELASPSSFPQF